MLNKDNTSILAIDFQEKLIKIATDEVKLNAVNFIKAFNILNFDIILTRQYPKGLGDTILEIKAINNFKTFDKTSFSVLEINDLVSKLKNNVVILGIETHICVLQSALDILKTKRKVIIPKDCCASRKDYNHLCALEILKDKGCSITTFEILLFEILKSSKHPNFKEIQGLIK